MVGDILHAQSMNRAMLGALTDLEQSCFHIGEQICAHKSKGWP